MTASGRVCVCVRLFHPPHIHGHELIPLVQPVGRQLGHRGHLRLEAGWVAQQRQRLALQHMLHPVLRGIQLFRQRHAEERRFRPGKVVVRSGSDVEPLVPGVAHGVGILLGGIAGVADLHAVGMALAGQQNKKDYMVYCMTGDGELNEGSNWEGAMSAAQFKLSNIVVLVDNNKLMIDGAVKDEMNIEPVDEKFKAFGFDVLRVDGHNMKELNGAIEAAIKNHQNGGTKPTAIIMDTIKGEGIDFIAGDYTWHYGSFSDEMFEKAHASLDEYYQKRVARAEKEG